MKRDPWVVLGISRQADDEEIKERYRSLARELHPDRNPGDAETARRFQEVAAAYESIRSADRRSRWQSENETVLDFDTTPRQAGIIQISFLEAFRGTERDASVEVEEICSACAGTGAAPGSSPHQCARCVGSGEITLGNMSSPCEACEGRGYTLPHPCNHCQWGRVLERRLVLVRIPPGAWSDQELIVTDGPRQFLFRVQVEKSPVFERTLPDPADLLLHVPVSYSEAVLGAAIRVPTPERVVEMQLPPGTPSGKHLRIAGAGMPREGGRGDLYVQVQIHVPSEVSSSYKRALEGLAQEDDPDEARSNLFRF